MVIAVQSRGANVSNHETRQDHRSVSHLWRKRDRSFKLKSVRSAQEVVWGELRTGPLGS